MNKSDVQKPPLRHKLDDTLNVYASPSRSNVSLNEVKYVENKQLFQSNKYTSMRNLFMAGEKINYSSFI